MIQSLRRRRRACPTRVRRSCPRPPLVVAPAEVAEVADTLEVAPVAPATPQALPATGNSVSVLLVLAGLLVGAGSIVAVFARRTSSPAAGMAPSPAGSARSRVREGRNSLTEDGSVRQGGLMSEDRIVVVGVDGSAGSAVALRWALDHADQLGDIEPVMTFVSGPFEYGFESADESDEPGEPYRSEAVLRLRYFLEANAPALVDSGMVIEHRAGPGLVKAARSAELLVVGTRGWSNRVDLSVGSVGAYCVRHSAVPVALIPHDVPPMRDQLDVVVGADGSPHSFTALRWALTHLRRSARITVVRAYTDHTIVGEPLSPSPEHAGEAARAGLEREVVTALRGLPERHAAVELVVRPGDPRVVLRTIGDDADVLVVGARGHGAIDHMLLGSVASEFAHHPTVPTVVVPHGSARTPGR